jgi:hypothetical protein
LPAFWAFNISDRPPRSTIHYEVDVVGAQAAQAVFDVLANRLGVAAAILGHQEAPLPLAVHGKRLTHDLFAAAVVVVPGVIEEGQPLIQGGVHDFDGFVLICDGADVPAAQGENRHVDAGLAQRPGRHSLGVRVVALGSGGEAQGRPGAERGVQELAAIARCFTHGMSPHECGIILSPMRLPYG